MIATLIALLPHEVAVEPADIFVDDKICGLPVVTFADPANSEAPRARFRLTADACRVLGIALIAAADISDVTGWGKAAEAPRH